MAYATQETRAVLHFDADCFFCQVECKRRGLDISSIAVCAQQHQDIISVNTKAKEAGVKKHMLPAEARKLLDPINGRVLHVYCEPTCGRVSYAPYRAASRQIIALIRSYLPSKAIVEVASIDELYVALPGTLRDAEALAATIRSAVLQKLGYVMSAGIAGNRLLSKLASNVAKPNGTLTLHTRQDISYVLAHTKSSKLPGLHPYRHKLVDSHPMVSDLQRLSLQELGNLLELPQSACEKFFRWCRGSDDTAVVATGPPTRYGTHSSFATEHRKVMGSDGKLEVLYQCLHVPQHSLVIRAVPLLVLRPGFTFKNRSVLDVTRFTLVLHWFHWFHVPCKDKGSRYNYQQH
eukprot:m.135403 g.135403  ORF g.135403 m.135403 type:complete len:348 (-) comp13973_c0_seq6:680-1723(-)